MERKVSQQQLRDRLKQKGIVDVEIVQRTVEQMAEMVTSTFNTILKFKNYCVLLATPKWSWICHCIYQYKMEWEEMVFKENGIGKYMALVID